jgi:hypothetical protein
MFRFLQMQLFAKQKQDLSTGMQLFAKHVPIFAAVQLFATHKQHVSTTVLYLLQSLHLCFFLLNKQRQHFYSYATLLNLKKNAVQLAMDSCVAEAG